MMLAYVAAFQWMLASAGSVVAGLLVWAMLAGASRIWPALLTRRTVWLAALGVTIGAALLPLLPLSAQINAAPTVTLSVQESSIIRNIAQPPASTTPAAPLAAPVAVSYAARSPSPSAPAAARAAGVPAPADVPSLSPSTLTTSATQMTPTLILPALWLLIYAAGLACALARLLRARQLWRGLLATARILSPNDLRAHGAFSTSQLTEMARYRLNVMETDATISPMLIGACRPMLLLPRHLRDFSAEQRQMIIAHELHHWRQRDPLCLGIAAALQTIFWFNPALRWIAGKLEWAQELACDQHVLNGRPQRQRKQYATALLRQWQTQTTALPAGGVAFGGVKGTTAATRIRHMQVAGLPTLHRAAAWLIATLMAGVLAAGAMLQPALAFSVQPLPAPETASPPEAWRYPLDKMRVTSFFGTHRSILPTPHKGIDLGAAKGTAVHATACGIVIAAGQIAENDGRYGNTIIIEHGAQRSLYAHLDSVSVRAGDRVEAGQRIGAVGETGFATGPHLHFEVRQDGKIIDPSTVLANLDAHATRRALKVRRQQLPTGI